MTNVSVVWSFVIWHLSFIVLDRVFRPLAGDSGNAFRLVDEDGQALWTNPMFLSRIFQLQKRNLVARPFAVQASFTLVSHFISRINLV